MSDMTPWRVKKLPDESLAYLVPDAEIRTDAGKMCVHVVVSTETMDRERDILIAKGCVMDDHKRNPIVLTNHRKDWPGVALAQDPSGEYTVKCKGDRITASNYFNQSTKLGVQTFRLVESGALRGVSPGFLTVPNAVHKIKAHDGHPAFRYDQWRLVEISHCPIGMNPDALVLAVEKGFGGESLLPELKDMLIPYFPEKKAKAVSGWEGEAVDDDDDYDLSADDIDLSDAEAVPLTPSSEFYHAAYQKAFDLLDMVKNVEYRVKGITRPEQDARRIVAFVGKILDVCKEGHAGHVTDYPDQPTLPDGRVDEGHMAEWRVKALEAWDEFKQRQRLGVAEESAKDVVDASKFFTTLAGDRTMPSPVRQVAKQFAGRLSRVKMVALPTDDEEEAEWGAVAAKLDAVGVK